MPKEEEAKKKNNYTSACERKREKERWSEKERTQKCGPPGLDADTGEGLLRGRARPYGCMAKWNPRGGGGRISLRGTLRCFLCTAVCGAHRSTDNDIRLSPPQRWLSHPQLTPLAKGQEEGRHEKEKVTCTAPRASSYLCHSIMTRGPPRKKENQQERQSAMGRREARD